MKGIKNVDKITFIRSTKAFCRSLPAIPGLKSSLIIPLGSLDWLFFKPFNTFSRLSIVHGDDLTFFTSLYDWVQGIIRDLVLHCQGEGWGSEHKIYNGLSQPSAATCPRIRLEEELLLLPVGSSLELSP